MISLALHPSVVGAGASGAIFGIAGLLISLLYVRKIPSAFSSRPKSLLTFVGYNLLFGLRAGVDNAAHVGGLIAGLLIGLVIAPLAASENSEQQSNIYTLGAAAVLLLLALSAVYKKMTTSYTGGKARRRPRAVTGTRRNENCAFRQVSGPPTL